MLAMPPQQRRLTVMLTAVVVLWHLLPGTSQHHNCSVMHPACFPAHGGDDDVVTVIKEELGSNPKEMSLLQMAASKGAQEQNQSWATCASMQSCNQYKHNAPCQCNARCYDFKNCCKDFKSTCNSLQPSYTPKDASLSQPSGAALLTFYMYRAQSDANFEPVNTNTASLGGVLWYLQNEIVPYCSTQTTGGMKGYRRYKKTRILRYKVTMRATAPLRKKGMHFGVRMAFDSGKNTGAWEPWLDMHRSYDKYGFVVGCNKLGHGPFPLCPSAEGTKEGFCPIKYGDNAVWYSLPGSCPSKDYKSKDSHCKRHEPGGYCKGTPTGAGDCTWTYEYAGEVNLDDLVGISHRFRSHRQFCARGCVEYVKFLRRGRDKGRCGIHFWDRRMDAGKNQWRIRTLDQAFKRKYPHMLSDRELPAPHCDVDRARFYEGM